VPAPAKLLLDARRPVAPAQLREDGRHQHVELLLLERAPRRPASRKRLMPGAGKPECAAHAPFGVRHRHRAKPSRPDQVRVFIEDYPWTPDQRTAQLTLRVLGPLKSRELRLDTDKS
jgi:hypothetical protein